MVWSGEDKLLVGRERWVVSVSDDDTTQDLGLPSCCCNTSTCLALSEFLAAEPLTVARLCLAGSGSTLSIIDSRRFTAVSLSASSSVSAFTLQHKMYITLVVPDTDITSQCCISCIFTQDCPNSRTPYFFPNKYSLTKLKDTAYRTNEVAIFVMLRVY